MFRPFRERTKVRNNPLANVLKERTNARISNVTLFDTHTITRAIRKSNKSRNGAAAESAALSAKYGRRPLLECSGTQKDLERLSNE